MNIAIKYRDISELKIAGNQTIGRFGHHVENWYNTTPDSLQGHCSKTPCSRHFEIYSVFRNTMRIFIMWSGSYRLRTFNIDTHENDWPEMKQYPIDVYCHRLRIMG